MKTKSWTALAVLLTVAAAALWTGCGSDSKKTDSASSNTGNSTDRAFVADMVPHHQSAVEMASVAQSEAKSQFVMSLADNISSTQKKEIAQMQRVDRKLADADIKEGDLGMPHETTGMHMDAKELRGAKPFDAKFIQMMVPHHEAAITMAKAELAKGKNPELRKLATNIVATQKREVMQMREHIKGASQSPGMHSSHSG